MSSRRRTYASWGRQVAIPARVDVLSPDDTQLNGTGGLPALAYGLGRSYGDACLNRGGLILDTSRLNRILGFDAGRGVLRAEAGTSLAQVLSRIVPAGWFLPVTPGTKHVTLGGAVANDVHGKNHHRDGTFGRFVRELELWRSDGSKLICSPDRHPDLFRATIGGLGLTGLIRWVEIRLLPIESDRIEMRSARFESLEEFFELNAEASARSRYTVAWVDATATGSRLGRGLYTEGKHAAGSLPEAGRPLEPRLRVPVAAPHWVLNRLTARAFNTAYWRRQRAAVVERTIHYEPFFFPLDAVGDWNLLYGRRGLFQYHFVVPHERGLETVRTALQLVNRSAETPLLAVLKTFGDLPSPGMLSFPMPGVTVALDFANRGERTRRLFRQLDALVRDASGRLYPAKDACMSAEDFRAFFPKWDEFATLADPGFSSSLWRRVGG